MDAPSSEFLKGNVSSEEYAKMVSIKGKEPLNPIGACFDTAAFQMVWGNNESFNSMRLCHAVVTASSPGQEGNEIVHAWIECKYRGKDAVLDTTWGEIIPKEEFYRLMKPRKVFSYTKSRTLTLWALNDYPGPWHPQLIEKLREITGNHSLLKGCPVNKEVEVDEV